MAENTNVNPALGEAAALFLAKLSPRERGASQPEVNRFVRWYGGGRPFGGLTAPEVANFAERLSLSDTDYARRLELIRAFLAYGKKAGWSRTNLAIHLKARKTKAGSQTAARQGLPDNITLTRQGHADLQAELASLKERRGPAIDEMRRAAADKDFRENAPLEAAREQRGHLEGRIREVEETLKLATIIGEGEKKTALRVCTGDSIVLCDLESGEERNYIVVHSKEVDPSQGKISNASPIGSAIIGRSEGDTVQVTTPAGKLGYQIRKIKR